MPIKNYSTRVPGEKTASEIVAMLARKGARAVMIEYDTQGQPNGLSWEVQLKDAVLPFKLPLNVEGVQQALIKAYNLGEGVSRNETSMEHARRVAWRILRDWVAAQMAILEAEMARLEEVFLPYLLTGPDETLFQRLQSRGLKALAPGE